MCSICIYVYEHAYVHIYVCICIYIYIDVYIHVHISTYAFMCMDVLTGICTKVDLQRLGFSNLRPLVYGCTEEK